MGHRILIVDDHPSFRASARIVLESEGFDVVGEAVDGASALTSAAGCARRSSCSTSSCPTPTASTSAQQITAHAEHPTVIMTSSRDGSDFGPLVTTSGARGFVPKAELSGERVQELLGS